MGRRSAIPDRWVTPMLFGGTLVLFARLSLLGGLALAPGLGLVEAVARATRTAAGPWRSLALGVAVVAAYFVYAIAAVLVVGAFRILTRAGSPVGRFSYYSLNGFRWARYNSLIMLVRYSCMNFMLLTPLINLFHRLMGMTIGVRVQINTATIFDSNLIEIGDDTVIGGDVTLIGHTAEGGRLVTGRVRIGRRVTVGLRAVVFAGVEIGDDAMIAPNAVLMRNTKVGPGEIWGGAPARKLGERRRRARAEPVAAGAAAQRA